MDINKLIDECISLCQNDEVEKEFNKIKIDLTVKRITAAQAKTKLEEAIDSYADLDTGKAYWVSTIQKCIDEFK